MGMMMQALRKMSARPGLLKGWWSVIVRVTAASTCGTDLHIDGGTAGQPGA
jgi:threonine dehydrogenase-like Zn-dependent dehydrogenase